MLKNEEWMKKKREEEVSVKERHILVNAAVYWQIRSNSNSVHILLKKDTLDL